MSKDRTRRTLRERVEAIFKFIDKHEGPFPKSWLKDIGINPVVAEKWLELIVFIQSQPKIRLVQSENNTLIEKIEGRYQALMRKLMTDETIPYEERIQITNNYLKSLTTREKGEIERQAKKK